MTDDEKKELFDELRIVRGRQQVLSWIHCLDLAIVIYLFLHFIYGL